MRCNLVELGNFMLLGESSSRDKNFACYSKIRKINLEKYKFNFLLGVLYNEYI